MTALLKIPTVQFREMMQIFREMTLDFRKTQATHRKLLMMLKYCQPDVLLQNDLMMLDCQHHLLNPN